jgi:HAD superfamily hydrolase (TIGR01490 family)
MDVEMDHARDSIPSRTGLQKNEDVMKRRIAFFDFDGTITTRDSLLAFIFFRHGRLKTIMGLLIISPFYVLYALKLIQVQKAKEKVLSRFFRNEPLEQFDSFCEQFTRTVLPSLIRPKAVKELQIMMEKHVEIVIVSASPENWLKSWCKQFDAALISTKLEVKNGKLTGKIDGKNCRGEEKVRRIRTQYDLGNYDEVYAYGDTKGDKPMLALATFAFYQPFR